MRQAKGEKRNAYRVLLGKPPNKEGRRRKEGVGGNSTKIYLEVTGYGNIIVKYI
jgi:hypothetical protein